MARLDAIGSDIAWANVGLEVAQGFNGTNSHINKTLVTYSSLTITCRFKYDGLSADPFIRIFQQYTGTTTGFVFTWNNGAVEWQTKEQSGSNGLRSSALNTGQYYDMVLTWDGASTVTMTVNGTPQLGTHSNAYGGTASNFDIGKRGGAVGNYFNGALVTLVINGVDQLDGTGTFFNMETVGGQARVQGDYDNHYTSYAAYNTAIPSTASEDFTNELIGILNESSQITFTINMGLFVMRFEMFDYIYTDASFIHGLFLDQMDGTVFYSFNIFVANSKSAIFHTVVYVDGLSATGSRHFQNCIIEGVNGNGSGIDVSDAPSNLSVDFFNLFIHKMAWGIQFFMNGDIGTVDLENVTIITNTLGIQEEIETFTASWDNIYIDSTTCFAGHSPVGDAIVTVNAESPQPANRNKSQAACFNSPGSGDYTPIEGGPAQVGVLPVIAGHTKYINDILMTSPFYAGAFGTLHTIFPYPWLDRVGSQVGKNIGIEFN